MRDSLAVAPPGSVVLGTGDHRLGAFLYAREALALRPDVHYVDARLLLNDAYRRRASERLSIALPAPVNRSLSTPLLATAILDAGRPLFLANMISPTLARELPTHPVGTLIRVLPKGSPLPSPHALLAINEEAFTRFTVAPDAPEPGTWQAEVRQSYAYPWRVLAPVFHNLGEGALAERCHARAVSFAP